MARRASCLLSFVSSWQVLGCTVGAAVALLIGAHASRADDPPVNLDRAMDNYRKQRQSEVDVRSTQGAHHRELFRIQQTASGEAVITPIGDQGDQAATSQPQTVLLSNPGDIQVDPVEVLREVPDPSQATETFAARYNRVKEIAQEETRVIDNYERVMKKAQLYLSELGHAKQARITLAECVQRALRSNYTIRSASYNPFIARMDLVRAEAVFDAVFFLNANYNNQDQPTASGLSANTSDTRTVSGGFRKLLPTGATVQTSLDETRSKTSLQFATLNPAYSNDFVTTITQPLLKGFGLDYNRSNIEIQRVNERVSQHQFEATVRDQVLAVEQAYWTLMFRRSDVLILAEEVAQNYATYQNMEARKDHDASPVEINNSLSQWQQNEVQYRNAVKAVREAEDRLKNLLNDPDFTIADDVELIPAEPPLVAPLTLDQFAEVRTALDSRSEIQQLKLQIEAARIASARAKLDTLPQLDLTFQYRVSGLGTTADNGFDNLTTNRYISYSVGVQFSVPFGQRDAWAALQQADARVKQALVNLYQQKDSIVEEVNNAVRDMQVAWINIPTSLNAVQAAERNLRALQARTDRIDPNYLQTELTAVRNLASTRETLLNNITTYNTSIANLERAKGTILKYNNIVISNGPTHR